MKELDYNIKASVKNTIRALGYIQDASAKIYSASDLTTPIWIGTVNSIGKVVDTYGNSPYLSYGDYRVIIEKCDYDTEISDFRVPDTSLVNLTVGCSSAITAHEITYDHSLIGQTSFPIVSKSTSYTATSSDYTIVCTAAITITIPSAVGIAGKVYNIKSNVASTVTITSASLIDSATTYYMYARYETVCIQSDGAQWWVV